MPIVDLCSKKLICVDKEATLRQVAQLMLMHQVGSVVVVDSLKTSVAVGIITDRDLALGVVAGDYLVTTQVSKVMSTDIVKVQGTDGIASVISTMEREGVRRVVIVDSHSKAYGLVTTDDILQLVAKEVDGLGKLVQRQLNREPPLNNFGQRSFAV